MIDPRRKTFVPDNHRNSGISVWYQNLFDVSFRRKVSTGIL